MNKTRSEFARFVLNESENAAQISRPREQASIAKSVITTNL